MTESAATAGRRARFVPSREAIVAAGVAVAAIAMVAWTWGTWPDPVNDSGRELYVAWQLAAGKVLYRDIAYFNGPLSPYVNAAWFALVGPGIAKLEALNGVVLAVIATVTWRLVRRASGWGAAAASVFVFVTVFCFGPLTTIGSFTYLLPYSHEMTHGLLLLLILLAAIDRFSSTGNRGSAILAGGLFGLIVLTKPEFVIAGGAATAVGVGLALARPGFKPRVAALAAFPLAAAVPPVLAWCALTTVMPARLAFEGLVGNWIHLTDRALRDMLYFRMFMGIDHPLANAVTMLEWSAAWAAAFLGAVAVGCALGRIGRFERPVSLALAAAVAGLVAAGHGFIPWLDAFRPLPVASLGVGVWSCVALWRRRKADPAASDLVLTAAAAAASLALTLKMILFARVWHYGFVLGMPGAMLAVAAGTRGARSAAARRGGNPLVAASVASGVVIGVVVSHLLMMSELLATRTALVGNGSDAFRSDVRGLVIGAALSGLSSVAPAGATLAVLPDGVMLSYLARRPNSTPYVIGNPADVAIFGEARMLEAYRASPPDFIALTRCDTSIYGVAGFGDGYAEQLSGWIFSHYDSIGVARDQNAGDDAFAAVLMKRRDATTPPASVPTP